MTQEELGITDIGLKYMQAIIARGELIERQEWERRFLRAGADLSQMVKERERAEAEVDYWRDQSRAEQARILREQGRWRW